MNVLVGTLLSGENEFDRCGDALRGQHHGRWEHFVLKNLPEREAHDQLYERFMASAGDFDLFLKLDADMILADPGKLGTAVELFEQDAKLDHAVFNVHDWMTDEPIIGIHMYRSRVRWPKRSVELFADLPPVCSGRRRYFLNGPPGPLAVHSPDPCPAQAFHYGLHRGLKAFQIGLAQTAPLHAVAHWRLLKRLWRLFDSGRDPRRGLALLGVELAICGGVNAGDCDYTSSRFAGLLDKYQSLTPDEVHDRLRSAWAPVRRETRWLGAFTRQVVRGLRRSA